MPMYRVRICWPRSDNSWHDIEASTSQEAADKVWPSTHVYEESKESERHDLIIEVTPKNAVVVERFDVYRQFHPLEAEPPFDGMAGVAYKLLPLTEGTD